MTTQGPPPASHNAEAAETATRVVLFFISYAPVALILGLRLLPDWVKFAIGAGIWFLLTTIAWWALRRQRRQGTRPMTVSGEHSQGTAVSGYLATYLLPFLTSTSVHWGDIAAYAVFLFVALVVYIRSDLALVNPTLYLLGYRVSEVSVGSRRSLIISRRRLVEGQEVEVSDFMNSMFVRA